MSTRRRWRACAARWREPVALDQARAELAEAIDKYVYWQFLAHRQWAELRIRARGNRVILGGDMAFSPARDSAEVWANRELFDFERTLGAPPDDFNPQGQRWGLPAPRWIVFGRADSPFTEGGSGRRASFTI